LEYLAFGLPVILAYEDTNLPNNSNFILRLPNVENNILPYVDKIKEFVFQWLNKRIDRKNITHIDSKNIEMKRLAFFNKILNKNI
ncbi:MAG: hypothetical protein ACTSPW_17535, partial [Promethearchaeota archaeon]